MASPPNALLNIAVTHHRAGQLDDAERSYKLALASDPKNFQALNLLAVLSYQRGRHAAAIDLFNKAIKLNSRSPEFHFNIGAPLQVLGRYDEAAAHYAKALSLKSSYTEAAFELANVLARQRKLSEAEDRYRRVLASQPGHVQALSRLGTVLLLQGKAPQAVEAWQKAAALDPADVAVQMNLAELFKKEGKLHNALEHIRRAVSRQPLHPEALTNLADVLVMKGNAAEAAEGYRLTRALLTKNPTPAVKKALARYLRSNLLTVDVIDVRADLIVALKEPWGRPLEFMETATRYVLANPAVADAIARASRESIAVDLESLAKVAADPLLRAMLETSSLCEYGMERFLTATRSTLLHAILKESGALEGEPLRSFACALARQCFINNYVYATDEAGMAQARSLIERLREDFAKGVHPPAGFLIAAASYTPLCSIPDAECLPDKEWDQPVAELLEQQLRQPTEERRLRTTIPALTVIEDAVSLKVREQYEENPYPQWTGLSRLTTPEPAAIYLEKRFPSIDTTPFRREEGIDVLVAGCGTGLQPLETASLYTDARVLAVDLSLASLSYAKRQAEKFGVGGLAFAQADLMELPGSGRTFDIIECGGVLHHLRDTFAGWRGLLSMLKPGGLMMVGLYSQAARADIRAAREFIAQQGYQATPDDIRRCRQAILAMPTDEAVRKVVNTRDFFSLSECRDLLFHVQEHNHTIPEIAAFLAENGLEFLGFSVDDTIAHQYAMRFPDDVTRTNLDNWHQLEVDNPGTFINMYQFWVRKPAGAPSSV